VEQVTTCEQVRDKLALLDVDMCQMSQPAISSCLWKRRLTSRKFRPPGNSVGNNSAKNVCNRPTGHGDGFESSWNWRRLEER